jgi:hypothetical protein
MTTATQPRPSVSNVRALASWLADNDLPGQRSMTAITRLRRERSTNLPPVATTPEPVTARLARRLVAEARREIRRRGGETVILGKNDSVSGSLVLADRDRAQRIILVRAEGWRYYSSRFGSRHVELAYLYGRDDAGPWAVRVPGSITTVREGLAWLTPAAVKQARAERRRVRRQGDVYAVETTARRDGRGVADLPEAHEWRASTRHLVHNPDDGRKHRPLRLPYPVEFIPQRAYEMGRSGARGAAD